MSDYISREAAIAAVHEHFDEILVYDESGETAANEIEDILLGLTPFIPIVSKTDERPVEWIPVGERLPEEGRLVLAAFDDVVLIASYGNHSWLEAATFSAFYPTHWMPLPEPPEGGANDG